MTRVGLGRQSPTAIGTAGSGALGVHHHLRQRVPPPHFVDRAVDQQLPLVDQRDAVAERLDLVHVVGGQDGGAPAAAAFEEQILHQADVDGIETGRRLIEDAQLRVGQEGAGNLHLLRHPLAQAIDAPRGHVRQLHALEATRGRGAWRRRGSGP